MEDLIKIGREFGFPALCLLLLCVSLWRAMKWVAPRIDQLVAAHLAFLTKTSTAIDNVDKGVDALNLGVAKLATIADAHTQALAQQKTQLDQVAAESVCELRDEISQVRNLVTAAQTQLVRMEERLAQILQGQAMPAPGSTR